jgi:hypothetical protein
VTESDAGQLIELAMSVEKAARAEGQNGGHQSRQDTDCAFAELQRQIMRHVVLAGDDIEEMPSARIVLWPPTGSGDTDPTITISRLE